MRDLKVGDWNNHGYSEDQKLGLKRIMAEAVEAGEIAGAAHDVFEKEPLGESPLLEMDNVVLTPHLGASSAEAQVIAGTIVVEKIKGVLC